MWYVSVCTSMCAATSSQVLYRLYRLCVTNEFNHRVPLAVAATTVVARKASEGRPSKARLGHATRVASGSERYHIFLFSGIPDRTTTTATDTRVLGHWGGWWVSEALWVQHASARVEAIVPGRASALHGCRCRRRFQTRGGGASPGCPSAPAVPPNQSLWMWMASRAD